MIRRGHTLIATVICVFILLLLAMVLMTGGLGGTLQQNTGTQPRKDKLGKTVPSLVRAKAVDEVCKSNLRQVRQGLQLARISSADEPPSSLSETKLGASFYSCPLGHEPYEYSQAEGTVKCVHPGHEKY